LRSYTITFSNNKYTMSEGGIYPWKVQRIQYPKNGGRPGNDNNLSRPLPDPPKDQIWVQDADTREWKLVPLVVATVAHDAEDDEEEEEMNGADAAAVVAMPASGGDANYENATAESTMAVANHGTTTTAIPIPLPTVELAISIDNTRRRSYNNNNANETSLIGSDGIRYHVVQPTDTFQGICLRYKLTPMELRRANNMVLMESNNHLALHTKLVIPMRSKTSTTITQSSSSSSSPTNNNKSVNQSKEEKIAMLLSKISSLSSSPSLRGSNSGSRNNNVAKLSYSEARAYLEIEDWDIDRAIESVAEDFGWSASSSSS
jgi:hypothetical protein